MIPVLPSPEIAAAVTPWLSRYGRREVRVLFHLLTHPGEHRVADLAAVFECKGPNLHEPLANLVRDGFVACRRAKEAHSKKPVNHYQLRAA
jgi:hypothetical protein